MSTYDAWEFEDRLDELARKLGELKGIDDALEMLRRSDDEYVDDVEDSGTPHRAQFEVRLGSTHPFTYSPLLASAGAEARARALVDGIDQCARQGQAWGKGEVAALRGRVVDLTRPDAPSIASIAQDLQDQVARPLGTLLVDNFARVEMGDFEGDTADAFAAFYDQLVDISKNQAKLATDVSNGIAAAGQVLAIAQHSLMGAVESALSVVEDQLQQRAADSEGTGLKEFLSLAALATGLIELLPGAGTGIKVVKELIAYGGREVPASSAQTDKIEARDAEQVAASLHGAVTRVLQHADSGWEAVDTDYVAKVLHAAGTLRTPEIGVDHHRNPGDFHHGSETY